MINYRLKVGYKKEQKNDIFLEKKSLFSSFFCNFCYILYRVKELEYRNISPISNLFHMIIYNNFIYG